MVEGLLHRAREDIEALKGLGNVRVDVVRSEDVRVVSRGGFEF